LSKSSGGVDVQQAITSELRTVRTNICQEFDMLSQSARDQREKGQRMLFLFQRDLMPGVNGQILESKQNRDNPDRKTVTASKKLLGWIFVVLVNLAMMFYILLFALQETKSRQRAWFKSFGTWLVMEIFFASSVVVFVTHILIPMIIMRDVGKIKQKLLTTIRDHYAAIKKARTAAGGSNAIEDAPETFNAAEYMFVSYRLAKLFPALGESSIILKYSTVWPKQSYKHKVDVTKSYSSRFSSLGRAVMMLVVFLVTNLLSIPPTFQDMVVNVISTATLATLHCYTCNYSRFIPCW